MYLKELASKFPGYCTLLVHGSGMGSRMAAGDIDKSLEDKIVKTIIPLNPYVAEILVEDE